MSQQVTSPRQGKILFLNQVSGPLFRELAEDVSHRLGPCVLFTGSAHGVTNAPGSPLRKVAAHDYDRRNLLTRATSWLRYFLQAFKFAVRQERSTLLFIVSNPPFLPILGYLLHRLRGQKYCVLVYDVYPNVLENLKKIRKNGLIARLWRAFNRLVWSRAEMIFTIGDYMAANVRSMLPSGAIAPNIVVVPNWADANFVKPLAKNQNWFAAKFKQVDRITVLYSGNMGNTHDIETLVETARQLRNDRRIGFLFIGSGAKWKVVENAINQHDLINVVLLPFQPEEAIPYTLSTADINVVTLDKGIEGLSVPSKTAYALASGAALLAVSCAPNELSDMIDRHQCGVAVEPGDVEAMKAAIMKLCDNPEFLGKCKTRARLAMEQNYSRSNTRLYSEALGTLFPSTSC